MEEESLSSSRVATTPHGIGRRSRYGCLMCKRRKKRCDQSRPRCAACVRLNLTCQYSDPSIQKHGNMGRPPRRGHQSVLHTSVWNSAGGERELELPLHFTDFSLRSNPEELTSGVSAPSLSVPLPAASSPVMPSLPFDSFFSPACILGEINSSHPSDIANLLGDEDLDPPLGVANEPTPSTCMLQSAYPNLDLEGIELFEYFRDYQSAMATVSPVNYFRTVFLAISLRCSSTLYALIGWAAWHRGDEDIGRKYFALAAERMELREPMLKEEVLASLLCMASGKICCGDVSDWRQYMRWAAEVIQKQGGLASFLESKSVRWLLKNFAYHEILASSSLECPMLFSSQDFAFIFSQETEKFPDTLCACCEDLFVELVAINELARDAKHQDELELHNEVGEWSPITARAKAIERKILACRPDTELLANLSITDLRLQVVLFEVFQKVAILHLYQCIFHVCSRSPLIRKSARELNVLLPQLLCSQVEGAILFPLFITGAASWCSQQRKSVSEMLDGLSKRVRARNVTQVKSLLEEVWSLDHDGTRCVDWNELAQNKGVVLSFA